MGQTSAQRRALLGLGACTAMSLWGPAFAQSFPLRPVKLIVPFAPGSGGDTNARLFGEQLAQVLGQQVVVENRPGASGQLGTTMAKNAPADGYTILVSGWSVQTVAPLFVKNLPFDPQKDFKPISGMSRSPTAFVVAENSPLRTLDDLLKRARGGGAELTVGTISSGQQIVLEWFSQLAGVKFRNVPYRSGSQMMTDLMGNQIDWAVEGMQSLVELLSSGKVRALATCGIDRSQRFPDIPTVKESGFPQFFSYGWSALYVRNETDDAIVGVLADAMQKVLASAKSKEFAARIESEVMPLGPKQMRDYESAELQRFQQVAQRAGLVAK